MINTDKEIENTEQVRERRSIGRNEFISVNEAVHYVATITQSPVNFASAFLTASTLMETIAVFSLDFFTGRATDSTPIKENDYTVWNKANEAISFFQHVELKETISKNLSESVTIDIEKYGWERKPFFDFIQQLLQRLAKGINTHHTQVQSSLDYLDPEHPRYAPKLAAAIKVWEAMEDKNLLKGKGTVSAMKLWLEPRYKELGLVHKGKINNTAIQEVAKVANWNEDGGAPTTPKS